MNLDQKAEPLVSVSSRVPASLHLRVKRAAAKSGTSVAKLTEAALRAVCEASEEPA